MFKALKKKLKDQRGLTLIELLAVVVILGIIAAIAVPSIGKLINNTKEDAKIAEGLQIISAAKLYTASEKLTFTSGSATIAHTALAGHLDNIQDTNGYNVIVTDTSGKYSYKLENHTSVPLVKKTTGTAAEIDDFASEDELLNYKR